MITTNERVAMTSPEKPMKLQDEWCKRMCDDEFDRSILFNETIDGEGQAMKGLLISEEEYASLITVGARQICVRFGLDDQSGSPIPVCIFYAVHAKKRIVSDYLIVYQRISDIQGDEGELSDQLANTWKKNYRDCMKDNSILPSFFYVPALNIDTVAPENKVLRGYSYDIQEIVNVLYNSGGDADVKSVQVLFGLHGSPEVLTDFSRPTCTFGILFHAADKHGRRLMDGLPPYYDIGTPCPDVC